MNTNAIKLIQVVFIGFFAILCNQNIYAQITSYPYIEDFEDGPAGWTVHGTTTTWELGPPSNTIIDSAAYGENAWVTNLSGDYLSNEDGWVQSPVFDLTNLTDPYIQFKINRVSHESDGAVLQVSLDNGNSWQVVGAVFEDINWYNSTSISGMPGGQEVGWTFSNSWQTAIYSLGALIGESNVIFRVAFGSDGINQDEGFAFDKVQISNSFCYANGEGVSLEIENGVNVSLNDLLDSFNSNSNNANGSWRYVDGPRSPRGPLVVFVSGGDDGDFPNTGSGPDEDYKFVYTVEDGDCQDTAEISVLMRGDTGPSLETEMIYIAQGEVIENADELFNAFYLDRVRYNDYDWKSGSEVVDFVNDQAADGTYIYYDETFEVEVEPGVYEIRGNELEANVSSLAASVKSVNFSFANPVTTNDGSNDYFEVDVLVQATGMGSSFKLGNGKLFFKYNPAAFGEFVNIYDNIWITHPYTDGYIAGQPIDSDPNTPMYGDFRTLDNDNDINIKRFSWSFTQNYSASTEMVDNVTNTPSKLCHIKIRYIDVNEDPMLEFETDGIYDNKFITAFGPSISRAVIVNDSFNNTGATLSADEIVQTQGITIFPNPAKDVLYIEKDNTEVKVIEVYSISGRQIMSLNGDLKELNISALDSGIYFLKLINENSAKTFKIIKK